MTQRLKTLARIETVQKRLVALADLRLAAIERTCRDLGEDQTRLRTFIDETTALGPSLAKAAQRATADLDRRLAHAENLRGRQKDHRDRQKRREHAVEAMRTDEAVVARRVAEDADLAEIMEAWLSRRGASLP